MLDVVALGELLLGTLNRIGIGLSTTCPGGISSVPDYQTVLDAMNSIIPERSHSL